MNTYSNNPVNTTPATQAAAPGFAASVAAGAQRAPVAPMGSQLSAAPALQVSHLAAHGFSPEIIHCWQESGIHTLLPLQADALTRTGLLRGSNIVALAPTSAGKTFVGEMAALRHWQAGRKTIFLCPTRALVAEQYRHLSARYSPLGIRSAMATADHTLHDKLIRRGDFDFAVMVYEKLRAFLVTAPDIIYTVGAVVADELQILGDPDRGETADLLLTRLVRAEPRVQLIGLSAVMDNADTLASWLDAELLQGADRPAELREGIYCMEHSAFHYRTAAHADWLDEPLIPSAAPHSHTTAGGDIRSVVDLCTSLARAGENCLLFVPTRALSRQLCMEIAAELGIDPAAAPAAGQDELRTAEDSVVRRQLMECIPAGVAFHNSELTADLRLMVEHAFNSGDIRVLVATPTLAQGVNLRAQNVIQVPLMLRGDAGTARQRPAQVPLSVERYRNQAGRAGRVGSGAPFGRSILVASGHVEAARLSRTYVQAAAEPVMRRFSDHSLEHFVLEFIHSGMADTYSGIHAALEHSFAWHCGALVADVSLEDRLGECLRALLDYKLIDETSGHRLRITGTGQAMAAGGFRAHTIREMLGACRDWTSHPPLPFEILCACAFTADGEQFALSATPAEMRLNVWVRAAWQVAETEGRLLSDQIRSLLEPAGGLAQAGHSSLKKAVLAHAWISDASTADIESRYHIVAGTVSATAAHLAWLAGGLAACASVLQCPEEVLRAIRTVAQRLPQGLAPHAAPLANLQVPGLTRHYLNLLAAEGFSTPKAVYAAPPETLERILPRFLVDRLFDRAAPADPEEPAAPASEIKPPVQHDLAPSTAAETADVALPADLRHAFDPPVAKYDLVLDPADPGAVQFHGHRLRLPPKPYALLCLLAQRCGRTVSYTSIDEIVWPGEKVEPQQISAHKSKLIRELGAATSRETAEAAIVTDPRYGLRLDLEPARVKLRPDPAVAIAAIPGKQNGGRP